MQYSGVLIMAADAKLPSVAEEVDRVPGVHVQFTYPESGRIIAVLETETVKEQQQTLRTVQGLPNVVLAELVYHRLDDGGSVDVPEINQAGKRLKTI